MLFRSRTVGIEGECLLEPVAGVGTQALVGRKRGVKSSGGLGADYGHGESTAVGVLHEGHTASSAALFASRPFSRTIIGH